jgi:hypothetical protein
VLNTTGVINGGLINSATTNARGTINGAITNSATGTFALTGNLAGNNAFSNAGNVIIGANTLSGLSSYVNSGTTSISGGTISATTLSNGGTLTVTGNGATFTGTSLVNNGNINLFGANLGSSFNATSAAYSGNGSISTPINLSQGAVAGTNTVSLNTASTSGGGAINFNVVGTGAVGVFPVVNASGSNAATFSTNSLPTNQLSLVQYNLVGPGGAGNATNSWAVVGTPNVAPVVSTLSSILSSISSIDAAFHQPAAALVASPQTTQTGLMVGGPWVRGSMGTSDIESTGTLNTNPGLLTANTLSQIRHAGIQTGTDIGFLNIGGTGTNAHFGLTGGFVQAKSNNKSTPLGGTDTFNSIDFNVPFAGAYATANRGPISADLTYRYSWYDMHVTNQIAGLNNTGFKGRSDNINGSLSYQIEMPGNIVVEPTANLSYTRGTFDTIAAAAGAGAAATNYLLQFQTVESLLARGGVRVATALPYDRMVFAPFVIGLVLHEFKDNARGAFISGGNSFEITTDRVGTFYQVSAGVSAVDTKSGFLGFVRGDLRLGDRVQGVAGNIGVRYTFGP